MVCRTCQKTLTGKSSRAGSSTALYMIYRHHKNLADLKESARANCFLCRIIWERLQIFQQSTSSGQIETSKGAYFTAYIRRDESNSQIYHLDFKLHLKDNPNLPKSVATFILLENDSTSTVRSRYAKPISESTSDPAVLERAKEWIDECEHDHAGRCREAAVENKYYPTRLIEVNPIPDSKGVARLVSSKEDEKIAGQPVFEGHYLTLSHCWGKKLFMRMTSENRATLQEAIYVNDLPLTFKHAIEVTRSLGFKYIWIDAICIQQDSKIDWLSESQQMRQVYSNSFCNISATAAEDSSQGLFRERLIDHEWTSVVSLKADDMEHSKRFLALDLSFWEKYILNAPVNKRSWVLQERLLSPRVLHWCEDQIAFECRMVDRAECRPKGLPYYSKMRGKLVDGVNVKKIDVDAGRQLRKMRMGSSSGGSLSRWHSEDTGGPSLKLMVQEVAALRDPRFYYYENWKRIVQDYTVMALTKDEDRLIALSGIARWVAEEIRKNSDYKEEAYLAGMWRGDLASQLMWHVNESNGSERQPFADWRPKDEHGEIYRAPSFSWASVETPYGITYGEPLASGILISIDVVRLVYRNKADNFGILDDGYAIVRGILRRVVMIDRWEHTDPAHAPRLSYLQHRVKQLSTRWLGQEGKTLDLDPPRFRSYLALQIITLTILFWFNYYQWLPPRSSIILSLLAWFLTSFAGLRPAFLEKPESRNTGNRWAWRLLRKGVPSDEEHSIVWLDSPASQPSIFGPTADVFVIPALRRSSEVICLLVQATDGDYGVRYKRIGLTKVSTRYKGAIEDVMTPPGLAKNDRYYWWNESSKGQSTICII